jgi:hypothetical protein
MRVNLDEHHQSKFYSEVPIESKKAEKLDDSLAVKIQDLSARIESLEKRKQ